MTCIQIPSKLCIYTKWVPNRFEANPLLIWMPVGRVPSWWPLMWRLVGWTFLRWAEIGIRVEQASWWLDRYLSNFKPWLCWTKRNLFLQMSVLRIQCILVNFFFSSIQATLWSLIVFSPSWQNASILGSFLLLYREISMSCGCVQKAWLFYHDPSH